MNLLLLLQSVAAQASEQMPDLTQVAATTVPAEAEINIIDLACKGGWIMIVLLLLSLMAIYIFFQRLLVIKRAGKEDQTFMNRIKDYIHEGKLESALNLCRTTNTPAARMIEKGFPFDCDDSCRSTDVGILGYSDRYGPCLLRYGKRR